MKLFKKKLRVKENDALLPKTRKELFKTIFSEDYYLIMDSSILLFVFSIPLLIVISTALILLSAAPSENIAEYVTPVIFWTSLLMIPALAIKYMGKISIYPIFKKRAFNEEDFFSQIFVRSFKEYYKRGLLLGLIVGIFFAANVNVVTLLILNSTNWLLRGLGIGAISILTFLIYMAAQYFMSTTNYYDLTFGQCFKNSMSFAIMDLFVSLIYYTVIILVPLFTTLLSNYIYYVWIVIFSFLLDGVSILFITLRSHYLFDLSINSTYYKDMVGKGLYKESPKED